MSLDLDRSFIASRATKVLLRDQFPRFDHGHPENI
jgi:hypothetical protein